MKRLSAAVSVAWIVALLSVAAKAAAPSDVNSGSASGEVDFPIPGVAQPLCIDTGQVSLNRCAGRWLRLTEILHEEILHEVTIPLLPQEGVQLLTTAIEWETFRDSHCALMALQVQGGSSYPMVLNNCLARTTNERIAALRMWGEAPTDFVAAEQFMEAAYGELVATMGGAVLPRLSQWQWETYRTEHCRYEAMIQTIDTAELNRLDNQCRARLAVERTAHLNRLADLGW